jgi:hypothetical protein
MKTTNEFIAAVWIDSETLKVDYRVNGPTGSRQLKQETMGLVEFTQLFGKGLRPGKRPKAKAIAVE